MSVFEWGYFHREYEETIHSGELLRGGELFGVVDWLQTLN